MKNFKIIAYSPKNRYADEYYNVFHQFVKTRSKLLKMENNSKGVNANTYKRLVKKMDYLEHEVPKWTRRANIEENRLVKLAKKKPTPNGVGKKLDFFA